jgi:hypothetical protein
MPYFSLLNFFTTAGLGIFCLLIEIYLSFYKTPVLLHVVMVTIIVASFLIWFILLLQRKAYYDKYPLRLKYNVFVNLNGYHTTAEILEAEIQQMLSVYKARFPKAESLLSNTHTFVTFMPGVFKDSRATALLAGIANGDEVKVGYFNYKSIDGKNSIVVDPFVNIKDTAFVHELGHCIITRSGIPWTVDQAHQFMKDNNVN